MLCHVLLQYFISFYEDTAYILPYTTISFSNCPFLVHFSLEKDFIVLVMSVRLSDDPMRFFFCGPSADSYYKTEYNYVLLLFPLKTIKGSLVLPPVTDSVWNPKHYIMKHNGS